MVETPLNVTSFLPLMSFCFGKIVNCLFSGPCWPPSGLDRSHSVQCMKDNVGF